VLNIPLLVQFPGQKQHQSSKARVMLMDLMPTCAGVAGVETPPVDGRDLRTSMQDGGYPIVLSECDGMTIIADGEFKYIQYQQKGREMCEAYDLLKDPHEFENVANDPAYMGQVSRMRGLLAGVFMRDFLK
jgi:arylsulfatase A-like enzyme